MDKITKAVEFSKEDFEKILIAQKTYGLNTASFIRFVVLTKLAELNLKDNSN